MEIPLTQGKVYHIYDEDWSLVAPYSWYTVRCDNGRWYARAALPGGDSNSANPRDSTTGLG